MTKMYKHLYYEICIKRERERERENEILEIEEWLLIVETIVVSTMETRVYKWRPREKWNRIETVGKFLIRTRLYTQCIWKCGGAMKGWNKKTDTMDLPWYRPSLWISSFHVPCGLSPQVWTDINGHWLKPAFEMSWGLFARRVLFVPCGDVSCIWRSPRLEAISETFA